MTKCGMGESKEVLVSSNLLELPWGEGLMSFDVLSFDVQHTFRMNPKRIPV